MMRDPINNLHDTRLRPHPDWPAQRSLDRYEHLVGWSIRRLLHDGGVWIDIGPGTHAVALRELDGLPGISLVGLTPDSVDVSGTGILVEHGQLPHAEEFLSRFCGKCRVVTDVFSATTYVDDPACALLSLSCLPGNGGKVGIFTELDKFGVVDTWGALERFFTSQTGQKLTFQPFNIRGDAEPIWVDCLRVTIEGKSRLTVADLPALKDMLHSEIGAPRVGREIWKTKDGKAVISEINYSRFSAPSELMRLSTVRPA